MSATSEDGDRGQGFPDLVPYRDKRWGLSLPLPDGWHVHQPGEGIAVVAIEPGDDLAFRTSVVVTVEDLQDGADLRAWQLDVDHLLPAALQHYLLLDLQAVTLDGAQAVRRLAHHVAETGHAVTVEQWAAVEAGRGYTLTASCSTLDFDALAEVFARVAEGFRLLRSSREEGH